MPKLHEILAVEPALSATNAKLQKETITTLGKTELFSGHIRTHQRFADDEQDQVQAPEYKEVETTATDVLAYFLHNGFGPYVDAVLQKDATNQVAFADIVIDGVTIAEKIPGTTLLGLESKLSALFPVFDKIPTLASGASWTAATDKADGVFTNPVPTETFQQRKWVDMQVVVQATEFHPAQTREIAKIDNVGKYIVTSYSGMVSSKQKAKLLLRLQKLTNAVKQARQRANHVDVVSASIGKKLNDYLLG